jgi:hypothetical protein
MERNFAAATSPVRRGPTRACNAKLRDKSRRAPKLPWRDGTTHTVLSPLEFAHW